MDSLLVLFWLNMNDNWKKYWFDRISYLTNQSTIFNYPSKQAAIYASNQLAIELLVLNFCNYFTSACMEILNS